MTAVHCSLRHALRLHRQCLLQPRTGSSRCLSTAIQSSPEPSSPRSPSPSYAIPSASSYLSLYRHLLRLSGRFDDDVIRHWLTVHVRFAFRRHRQQHVARHVRESHRLHERRAAQQYVKDRIHALVNAQPLPAPFVATPPDSPSPSALSLVPTTTAVSYSLRRQLHVRYRSGLAFLRQLQRAEDGNRLARVRLLSLAYGFAGPLMGLMVEARSRLLVDPHWWEETQRTYPLHPMQEAAVRIGLMGSGREGEGEVDWTVAYRLMVLDRCKTMDRDWRRAFKAVLQVNQVPQRAEARQELQWDVEGEEDSEEVEGGTTQLEDAGQEPLPGGWVEWSHSAQRRLALLIAQQRREQLVESAGAFHAVSDPPSPSSVPVHQ